MQVFRAAKICGIVRPETELKHIGFGTVNGKDGKPFKTRDGGVPRLESLIDEINTEMLKKIRTNEEIPEDEQAATARQVAMISVRNSLQATLPARQSCRGRSIRCSKSCFPKSTRSRSRWQ